MDALARLTRPVFGLLTGAALAAALFLLLAVAGRPASAASIKRYVSPTGHDTGNCSTISGRCRTTQYAVGVANPSDVIWLGEGTYTGVGAAVVAIDKSLTLLGGWDGAHAGHRDPLAHPTVVDGQGTRRGVSISHVTVVEGLSAADPLAVTLEGFTITNGVADAYGAGLYARDVTLTLRAMSFYSNVIDTTLVPDALGGGAMVEGGTLWAEGCTFRYNSAQSESAPAGGGLAISGTLRAAVEDSLFDANDAWFASGLDFDGSGAAGATLAIRHCRFQDNGRGLSPGDAGGGYRGGIDARWGSVRVEDSTFVGNFACSGWGAAVGMAYGSLVMERNAIHGNQSWYDTSALWLYDVSPFTLTNNLIVENGSTYNWEGMVHQAVDIASGNGRLLHNTIARNGNTYGIRLTGSALVTLTNNILVSHTVGISVAAGSTVWFEHMLWGDTVWGNIEPAVGDGVGYKGEVELFEDPIFVAPDQGNYRLAVRSRGVDEAVDRGVTDDVDGRNRPRDGDRDGIAKPDIGASEADGLLFLPALFKSS